MNVSLLITRHTYNLWALADLLKSGYAFNFIPGIHRNKECHRFHKTILHVNPEKFSLAVGNRVRCLTCRQERLLVLALLSSLAPGCRNCHRNDGQIFVHLGL